MDFSVSSLQRSDLYPLPPDAAPAVDLERVDPYSLESLKDLLDSRLNQGLDFYVVAFKEGGYLYFFEASRFCEQVFKKNLRNPLTNIEVGCFEILRYSDDNKFFEFYCDSEQVNDPAICLPIFISDHTRADIERRMQLHKLGCHYLEEGSYDPTKAIKYLTQAAEKGSRTSQKLVGYLMFDNKKIEEGFFWFNKYLEGEVGGSPMDLIYLATQIRKTNLLESFNLFRKAALKGNYFGIAGIIDFYERETGLQDYSKALLWRQALPVDWQECSVTDFLNHLEEDEYDSDTVAELDIPAELFP